MDAAAPLSLSEMFGKVDLHIAVPVVLDASKKLVPIDLVYATIFALCQTCRTIAVRSSLLQRQNCTTTRGGSLLSSPLCMPLLVSVGANLPEISNKQQFRWPI